MILGAAPVMIALFINAILGHDVVHDTVYSKD